jgi:hypothetical protein
MLSIQHHPLGEINKNYEPTRRLDGFRCHWEALDGGAVGGVGVQLLQISGIELDPRSAGANDEGLSDKGWI